MEGKEIKNIGNITVSKKKLKEIEASEYLIINGITFVRKDKCGELMTGFYKQQIVAEDQNQLFTEVIECHNKKEHTQDGRNLMMENFTIQRKENLRNMARLLEHPEAPVKSEGVPKSRNRPEPPPVEPSTSLPTETRYNTIDAFLQGAETMMFSAFMQGKESKSFKDWYVRNDMEKLFKMSYEEYSDLQKKQLTERLKAADEVIGWLEAFLQDGMHATEHAKESLKKYNALKK